MLTSVLDIFKVGIGPSSSHTMGPMVAAGRFLDTLRALDGAAPAQVVCSLHGSLAFTGKGHGTDRAVILGLVGCDPTTVDPDDCERIEAQMRTRREIAVDGLPPLRFDPAADIVFDYGPPLPHHSNGLRFVARDAAGEVVAESTYYSIGGGFVLREDEMAGGEPGAPTDADALPYPFANAGEMLATGRESGLRIAEMMRANETARRPEAELDAGLGAIWSAMSGCIDRGLRNRGTLPGGLKVERRAATVRDSIERAVGRNDQPPHRGTDWLLLYAMAANEENAAGGRVVTAPTNGAAGVIPSVLRYYLAHCPNTRPVDVREFLLAAAAIGGIIKRNASISGAEVGCQGEVGSASAMAAAGLCSVQGGSNEQVENAAEIALEHHLGMTCDPIGGLVQVPCIERNGFGAIKATAAASLSLHGSGQHFVSLDSCIETMRQTGLDMSEKYKETSQGGLAVNVVAC